MGATEAVWKFPLRVEREQNIDIPGPWEPLTIAMQNGRPCLWASVTPDGSVRSHRVVMVGTGHAFDNEGLEPLGTVIDGPYVWHYFLQSGRRAALDDYLREPK